jgi:hypothetical protein
MVDDREHGSGMTFRQAGDANICLHRDKSAELGRTNAEVRYWSVCDDEKERE